MIHLGDWDEQTRQDPVLRWLETFACEFDARFPNIGPLSEWFTNDFKIIFPDGRETNDAQSSWDALRAVHEAFTEFKYETTSIIAAAALDQNDEWDVLRTTIFCCDKLGQVSSEISYEDRSGRKWDFGIPGVWKYRIAKSALEGDYRIRKYSGIGDPTSLFMKLGFIPVGSWREKEISSRIGE